MLGWVGLDGGAGLAWAGLAWAGRAGLGWAGDWARLGTGLGLGLFHRAASRLRVWVPITFWAKVLTETFWAKVLGSSFFGKHILNLGLGAGLGGGAGLAWAGWAGGWADLG